MVVKVESIEASELKERLMSMGMVKGTKVKVLRTYRNLPEDKKKAVLKYLKMLDRYTED